MRVAAITRVLNEADVIEAFVRHTAAYATHHVFNDNGSADGTVDILKNLAAEGLPISVYQSRAVTFNESDALTQLYEQACHDVSPDYLKLPTVDYIATSLDDKAESIVPSRMRRRRNRRPTDEHKIILRGHFPVGQLTIQHGSHSAILSGRPMREVKEERLRLAHYAERSPYQYIMKFVRGWSKVLASGQEELNRRTAYHYKGPFEHLRDRPSNLLRNPRFMGFKDENEELFDDPINYRGGKLRYSDETDDAMRAARSLMGLLNDLATRHGMLMDEFPFVRALVQDLEQTRTKLF